MATKKNKKEEPSYVERELGSKLGDKEIAKFQQIVARIGKRKTSGFLYIIEEKKGSKPDKDSMTQDCTGLLFSNDVNHVEMVMNLICSIASGPFARLRLLTRIVEEIKSQTARDMLEEIVGRRK